MTAIVLVSLPAVNVIRTPTSCGWLNQNQVEARTGSSSRRLGRATGKLVRHDLVDRHLRGIECLPSTWIKSAVSRFIHSHQLDRFVRRETCRAAQSSWARSLGSLQEQEVAVPRHRALAVGENL